jgi:hypothetical protein
MVGNGGWMFYCADDLLYEFNWGEKDQAAYTVRLRHNYEIVGHRNNYLLEYLQTTIPFSHQTL